MVIAVISTGDLGELLRCLARRGYRATVIDQSGGLFQPGSAAILIGVQEALVADVLRLIAAVCRSRVSLLNPAMPMAEPGEFFVPQPVEARMGGAVCYVLNVERYERVA